MITGMIAVPITVIGGALLYYWYSCRRAQRRNKRGLCARCGDPLGESQAFPIADLMVCSHCAQTTERNSTAALRFAIGITILLVALLGIGFGSDYAKGVRIDSGALKMLLAVLLPAGAFCSIIWRHRIKLPNKENSNKDDGRTTR
jgi:hypothetical protein